MILLCRTSRLSEVRSVGPGKCLSTDSQDLFEVRPHYLEICNEKWFCRCSLNFPRES